MESGAGLGACGRSGGRDLFRRQVGAGARWRLAGGAAPETRLDRAQWAEGDRWIDSATAMISATPLNMSFSQLAPDTS